MLKWVNEGIFVQGFELLSKLSILGNICGAKSATLLKVTLLYGCFSRFLNDTIGTKSRKASHLCVIEMINS